jgi:hypothetical protein
LSDTGEIVLNLPVEARAWAKSQGFPLLDDANEAGGLILTSPMDKTTFKITPEVSLGSQQISISTLAGTDFSYVTFFVDGAVINIFYEPPYQSWWKLSLGRHLFWAVGVTESGKTFKSNIVAVTVEK